EIFARISIAFMDQILSIISSTNDIISADNIGEYLIGVGITSLSLVAAFIFIAILYFQILMRGVEMWVMRCGFYLACVGLVESDNGAFAPYLMTFFKCALTTFIQVTLLLLGTNLLIAGDTFIGFAFMGMAIGTPKFLQQFMVPAGGGSVMGKVYQGVHLADMAMRFSKG
ncbi:MAG: conjugal transfer protein TrbL family protein, partial [Eubacteriaceae bacterium]